MPAGRNELQQEAGFGKATISLLRKFLGSKSFVVSFEFAVTSGRNIASWDRFVWNDSIVWLG